jgi:hypothetical protein
MQKWIISENGSEIDEVYFKPSMSIDEVYDALLCDDYPPWISLRRAK